MELIKLPDDVLICIFQYLPFSTIIAGESTCRRFRKLLVGKGDALWKDQFQFVFGQSAFNEMSIKFDLMKKSNKNISWKRIFWEKSTEIAIGIYSSKGNFWFIC